MKRIFVVGGILIAAILVVVGAGYGWASSRAESVLSEAIDAHEVDFPVPVPLPEEETPEGADRAQLALERSIERGRHLLTSRYACSDCHGENYGGGVMIDDPAMGSLLAPNLTAGAGSAVSDYTVGDWDHIVRHGIRKDGRPALMPSEDFAAMSDQELGDIIAHIRSLPPVDNEVPPSQLGPIGKVLVATGKFPLSARVIGEHFSSHLAEPPEAQETLEFGGHIAKVCTGCHRQNFEGGPIVQGPPDWAPASNLTPHAEGLAAYDFAAFEKVMRQGIRPNDAPVSPPMNVITTYASNMTETELKALWLYLRSVPAIPRGK